MGVLGEYLRLELSRLGWTQRELAEVSGLASSTVSDIIKGRIARPDPDTLRKLARTLDIQSCFLTSMIGYDVMGAESIEDKYRTMALTMQSMPELGDALIMLMELPEETRRGIIQYIEFEYHKRDH